MFSAKELRTKPNAAVNAPRMETILQPNLSINGKASRAEIMNFEYIAVLQKRLNHRDCRKYDFVPHGEMKQTFKVTTILPIRMVIFNAIHRKKRSYGVNIPDSNTDKIKHIV